MNDEKREAVVKATDALIQALQEYRGELLGAREFSEMKVGAVAKPNPLLGGSDILRVKVGENDWRTFDGVSSEVLWGIKFTDQEMTEDSSIYHCDIEDVGDDDTVAYFNSFKRW